MDLLSDAPGYSPPIPQGSMPNRDPRRELFNCFGYEITPFYIRKQNSVAGSSLLVKGKKNGQ
jgi:hypothetical protein